jgi:3-methyladenine DNA glycosylase AlkD
MPASSDHILPPGATTVPQLRKAALTWAKHNKDISARRFQQIVTGLIHESDGIKKCMGGILLGYMPAQRSGLSPFLYDEWLEHTEGWGAVDAICYGHFTATEILDNFAGWKTLIKKLAKSPNANKRRAALVLLTKPVKESGDKQLSALAFGVIETLKEEKVILITKAISWLLRNLTRRHGPEVRKYLAVAQDSLPKIAVRETRNKLNYGKKTGGG